VYSDSKKCSTRSPTIDVGDIATTLDKHFDWRRALSPPGAQKAT